MKGLTYGMLRKMVQEVMLEANVSGNAGAFSPKTSFRPSAPFTQQIKRPKHPSHTKFWEFK